ncbi:MAG: hypothetical protein B7X79_11685 [Acidovorax sp. 17-64-282]|nr:MAG: hypothetical protein B7X79_11685 [Acidovorax sp. 17-64-282]
MPSPSAANFLPSAPLQVRGACPHDCPDTCALLTTVENGVATRVQGNPDHPHTDGVLCTKVSRYTERSYHPERILTPLKRTGPKGSGQFAPVSWDEALAEITQRLGAIAARNPEAILPYSYAGTMGMVQGESMDRRFFHRLGASQLDRTICASAGAEALVQTLGGKVGMKVEFFAQAKLILIWGSNSIGSNLHFWRYAQQAKRNGARLVCIDPRKTETADKCHEHIALRPGTDAALALALMHELIKNALTGAWRHRAGGMLLSSSGQFPAQRAALQRPDLMPARTPRTLNMVQIGDDLMREASPAFGPRVEALVVYNSNPVAVAPDSGKVVQGFAREDLFTVVLEHFQTDTADYADFILPATTQLEHWDVHLAYGHTDVLLNRPAIAPLGRARSNAQIFRDLAARMGFTEPCFADSDEALCRQAFGDAVDFALLETQGFATLALPDAPFAEGGFATPSGKCEFFSARLAAQGLDGLPDHLPNHELQGSSAHYPLAMISPPARNFLNSTFVNVQSLRDIEGRPVLEIHPDDALARGIGDGAVVRVFNDRGSYRCHAAVSLRARPGVVNGLGIWWRKLGLDGTNVNQLTSQALTDMGRAPTFYDCLVEVQACAPHAA